MNGVNKFIGIGNLTADPEFKVTEGGLAVCNFSIACNETWKNKDGSKEEKVEFINIVTFSKLADICGEYLTKGKPVYIEGKMQTRKWEDKEGNTRYTTEIVANNMQMLGSKGEKQESNQYGDSIPPEPIPF